MPERPSMTPPFFPYMQSMGPVWNSWPKDSQDLSWPGSFEVACVGIPKTIPIFRNLLQALMGLNIQLNSWLRSITGTSLPVQWLRLHLPMQRVWVRSLMGELRPHMSWGQKTKTPNRSNVTNSIKTLKMVHTKKSFKKYLLQWWRKDTQSDPNGKRQAESREIHAQASCALFLWRTPLNTLLSPGMKNAVTCVQWFCPVKPTRNKAFNTFIFLGGCPHLHSLPSIHQNSRLPERKQMFSINILVCANKVQRTTLVSFENDRNTLIATKGQSCKLAPSKDSSLRPGYSDFSAHSPKQKMMTVS